MLQTAAMAASKYSIPLENTVHNSAVLAGGNGQFVYPNGIAVDSAGKVYVADSGNHRVQIFDSSGKYIAQFGSIGRGNGQFTYNNGIAVDSKGNVYVADSGNARIQIFDSSGKYICTIRQYRQRERAIL